MWLELSVYACRSESPSQVFLMVIRRLYSLLKEVEPSQWKNVVISYDNMCHLDCLRAAQAPLPLPAPYCEMWQKVTKIIDSLHIKNHKDPKCLEKYTPARVKEEHPHYNTMVCEQTFVWLSRFKKIVCSMPKEHHLFSFTEWWREETDTQNVATLCTKSPYYQEQSRSRVCLR